MALRPLDAQGPAAGLRPRRRPTARRSSRCCAARRSSAGWPARSRRESGFNDPIAVLLVLGFIDWDPDRRLRARRHRRAARAPDRDRRWRSAWGGRCRCLGAAARDARHRRPVPGRDARRGRAGLRRRRRPARLGLPRRLPGRAGARHGRHPRPADGDLLPPGPGLGRAGGDVRLARAARLPAAGSTTSPCGGRCWRSSLVFVSRPVAVAVATLPARFTWSRAPGALGAPGCAAPCPSSSRPSRSSPGVDGSTQVFDVVFFAVLLSTILQGTTFEPLARALGATTDRAGAAAPAGRGGDDQAAGGRDPRVPGRPRRRGRRRARARPRAAPRGGGQRDRARRRGDPAARVDHPARRRPPARAAALGALARCASDRRALAPGADRPPPRPRAAPAGPPAHLHRGAVRPGAA